MPEASPPGGAAAAFEVLRRTVAGQPHGSMLLAGPAAPARRRLLEALAAQLRGEGLASVWLEGGDLAPAAIWAHVAGALGVTPGYDARRRVLLHLQGDGVARQGGVVLLVPEAEELAADSLRSLVNNARSERGLHVVLAAENARALAAALPEDATTIAWDGEPLAGMAAAEPPARASAERVAERSPGRPAPAGVLPPAPPPEASPLPPPVSAGLEAGAANPARRALRGRRSRAGLRGMLVVLAGGLAFAIAWGAGPLRGAQERAPAPASPPAAERPFADPERPRAGAALRERARASAAAEPLPEPIPEVALQLAPSSEPAAAPEPAPPSEPVAAAETPAAAPSREPGAPPAEELPRKEPATAQPAPPPPPVAQEPTRVAPAPTPAPAPPPLARGTLRIDADRPLQIEIDGRPYGRTPLAGIRLPRGRHRVVARYPDGATAQKSVVLGDEDVAISYR